MSYLGLSSNYTNISFGGMQATQAPPLPSKNANNNTQTPQQNANKIKKIRDFIKKYDIYFIGGNTKAKGYWAWYNTKQGLTVSPNLEEQLFTFSGLVEMFTGELSGITNLELLDELGVQKRKFFRKVFSNQEEGNTIYNCSDVLSKNLMKFDPASEGVKSDVLDTLFLSVAGGCHISKEILEKSLVAHIENTRNKNWDVSSLPPTVVCYGNGATGKSLLFNKIFPTIFSRKSSFMVGSELAGGRFNSWIMGKRLIIFSEIVMNVTERIKFTNKIKAFLEAMISIEGKGTDAEEIPFMAWMFILSNGQAGAVDLRGSDGVARRFQVMEGKLCLGEMLVNAGLYTLTDDEKKSLEDAVSNDAKVNIYDLIVKREFSSVFDDEEVIQKHCEYLIRKYYKELKQDNFKVSPIHTKAYYKLLNNQQGQYQENFIDWVHTSMMYDHDHKIRDLYNKLDEWAGKSQVRPYSFDEFEKSILTILQNRPELKYVEYCKKVGKKQISVKIDGKVKSFTGLFIRKHNHSLMLDDKANDRFYNDIEVINDQGAIENKLFDDNNTGCNMFEGDSPEVKLTSPVDDMLSSVIDKDKQQILVGLNNIKTSFVNTTNFKM